ncbi:MAG TPA: glutamyl-tRNA reductase [Gaiellaceae bacterium]|nr:glutamyl-tRNA reductase [Gaiellaceae bacterium]
MRLLLVGTSYQRAPVELRELLAYDPALRAEALGRLSADGAEVGVLSTCNRTEVYAVGPEPDALEERIYGELASLSGLSHSELAPALYTVADEAAALHLFRVAAGLDSMVPGEAQILGQVREAYNAACESGTAGPILHRLFRQALGVGKRVRTETAIGENPASVSSAAAQLADRVFEDLEGRTILLLGAGKVADLTAANLISRGVGEIVVANRTLERAEPLARRLGGRAVGLDGVEAELERADVVVASTSSQGVVLTAEQVARALEARRGRPVFFIDIAVPRDLDPAINELEGCYLYDIDDLERVVAESVAGRREEAVRAEAIVSEEADEFRAWQLALDVVPAIASLRARAESIRQAELERAEGRLASLSPSQRRAVEALTTQIVAKLLHQPTVRMKEAAVAADGVLYADAVRHLFGLEERDAGPTRHPGQ